VAGKPSRAGKPFTLVAGKPSNNIWAGKPFTLLAGKPSGNILAGKPLNFGWEAINNLWAGKSLILKNGAYFFRWAKWRGGDFKFPVTSLTGFPAESFFDLQTSTFTKGILSLVDI